MDSVVEGEEGNFPSAAQAQEWQDGRGSGEEKSLSHYAAHAARRLLQAREAYAKRYDRPEEKRIGYIFAEELDHLRRLGQQMENPPFVLLSARDLVPAEKFRKWQAGRFTAKETGFFYGKLFSNGFVTHLVVLPGWENRPHAKIIRAVLELFDLALYGADIR